MLPEAFVCGFCENFYGKYENIFEIFKCTNCNFQLCSNCEFTDKKENPIEKQLYQKIINTLLVPEQS